MITTRIGNAEDINGILGLQEKNLSSNLSEEQKKGGFVTTPFTIPQIEKIIEERGIFVALNETNEIISYVFAGSWNYFKEWEIFNYMVSLFPKTSFQDKEITAINSFQYGPICIDTKYRGQKIINLIFEEMRLELKQRFPISITFINKTNIVSKKAHTQKLGWKIIKEFSFNNNEYYMLGLDMEISVLH